ncbi:unnamed protein product, partial [Amoebophrya sp. A25]
ESVYPSKTTTPSPTFANIMIEDNQNKIFFNEGPAEALATPASRSLINADPASIVEAHHPTAGEDTATESEAREAYFNKVLANLEGFSLDYL